MFLAHRLFEFVSAANIRAILFLSRMALNGERSIHCCSA
jgi:hypothetical protein